MLAGIDRLFSLFIINPFVKMTNRNHKIPILMYHSISEKNDDDVPAYYRQNTHPDTFEAHMRILTEKGYKAIDLNFLMNESGNPKNPTAKYVLLSFDDGFENFYTNAYPILDKYGLTATMYIISSMVGKEFKGRKCMSWSQIDELSRNGITMGSHTVTHPILYSLSKPEIKNELLNSKHRLEDKLGSSIDHFAYPYAFPENDHNYIRHIKETLKKIGYQSCMTTIIGRADKNKQYFLKRLPINSTDDKKFFEAKLNGAYDWLRLLQYASKSLQKKRS
jgi:peptidoglycan/xylan/chitin deacetylase (PgdA/CDA1 family)